MPNWSLQSTDSFRPEAVSQRRTPIFSIADARSRAEALVAGDSTRGGLIALLAGLFEKNRGKRPVYDLQHLKEEVEMDGKKAAQGNRG